MQFTYFFVLNDSGTIKSKTQGQWKLKKTEGASGDIEIDPLQVFQVDRLGFIANPCNPSCFNFHFMKKSTQISSPKYK